MMIDDSMMPSVTRYVFTFTVHWLKNLKRKNGMLNISFHIYDVENEALFSYDSILAEAILDLIIVCPILVPIH